MEGRRYDVVLADDVAALRRLVRLTLESSGRFAVVGEAATGVEALEVVRRAQPDLVLLDLSMPQMDGLEALPHIVDASPVSRVVVFSGFTHARMAPVALRMGAKAYLEKGLEPEKIVTALLGVLEDGKPPSRAPAARERPSGHTSDAAAAAPGRPPSAAPARTVRPLVSQYTVLWLGHDAAARHELHEALQARPGVAFEVRDATGPGNVAPADLRGVDLVVLSVPATGTSVEPVVMDALAAIGSLPMVLILPEERWGWYPTALRLGVEDCLSRTRMDPDLVTRSLLFAIERRRALSARQSSATHQRDVERLEELEATKTEFFNAVAHELHTPLTPIKLQLHMLRSVFAPDAGPEALQSLEVLDRNVDRLIRLTDDLLDVARLQMGHLRLRRERFDLSRSAEEVVESFLPMARSVGVRLVCVTEGPLPVPGDPERVSQVLYNLVSNALKFTRAGGDVEVHVAPAGDEVVVRVQDTGPGLWPDQIARLFQPFSQVHPDNASGPAGTGLGLFISKGIVDLHGGRIWCQSDGTGQGAQFAFALPRAGSRTAEAEAEAGGGAAELALDA